MLAKKPPLLSRFIAVGSILCVGALIVGFTIYMIFYLNEPVPRVTQDVSTNMDKGLVIGK